jgi:hypothetical protein
MICLAFSIIPIVFTCILTCEPHVIFIRYRPSNSCTFSLRLTRYKRREWRNLSASEQFHRICQTTHHIIIPMDFFADLFTITSNTPEAEPAPSAPIDAAGGTGGCIVA